MMESMQSKSVKGALIRLQFRMGRIKKVAMDADTNMVELKRMSEESNGLLQIEEAVVHPVSDQFRNYCERSVRMVKKVARMMLRKRKNEKLPTLMREEALSLWSLHAILPIAFLILVTKRDCSSFQTTY